MLEWDSTEFIECLETLPTEGAEGEFSIFKVARNNIELELTVFPFEEDIRFRLLRLGETVPFFEYQIMSCKSVEFVKSEKVPEYLRFINQSGMNICVSIKPDIKVTVSE